MQNKIWKAVFTSAASMIMLIVLGCQASKSDFEAEFGIKYPTMAAQKEDAGKVVMVRIAMLNRDWHASIDRYLSLEEQSKSVNAELPLTKDQAGKQLSLQQEIENAAGAISYNRDRLVRACSVLYNYESVLSNQEPNYPDIPLVGVKEICNDALLSNR